MLPKVDYMLAPSLFVCKKIDKKQILNENGIEIGEIYE